MRNQVISKWANVFMKEKQLEMLKSTMRRKYQEEGDESGKGDEKRERHKRY